MGELTPNYESSIDFLQSTQPGGGWVLVAIKVDGSGIETKTFDDREAALGWLKKVGEDSNIYWTVNSVIGPMSRKPGRKDVKSVDFLHVDIDPRDGYDLEEEQESILARLRDFKPTPSLIIYSGGGYQAFWKLQDPIQVNGDEGAYEDAKYYNIQLERLLGGDHCHNVDRIMRLPYTINRPNAKKLAKGRVETLASVYWHSDLSYPLSTFTPAPMVQSKEKFESTTVKIDGNVERITDLDSLPLDDDCKRTIATGKDPDRPERWTSRSEPLFWVCCEMVRAGMSNEQIYAIITDPCWGISESVIENRNGMQRYAERQIERARDHAERRELGMLNDRHAVVMVGGKTRVITEQDDVLEDGRKRSRLLYQTFDDFRNFYSNQFITLPVGEDGKTKADIPLGKWWLSHKRRRTYNGVVFQPGAHVSGYYNLWKGFGVEAIPGDCSLFLDHIHQNLCGGNQETYDYLIRWMATAVQDPAQPGHVAIVLRGRQGTGKGAFANIFGRLFGRHFLAVRDSEHLFGKFNAHLKDCVILFADEAFWAGDKKREGMLKSMVTETHLMSERKGYEAELSENYIHLIMASNEGWVVPAGMDDRRFLVLDVEDTRMQDTSYFKAILDQMDAGGYQALLYHLLTMDLEGFNIRKVPQTEALIEQKMLSMSPEQSWWFTKLLEGRMFEDEETWPEEVFCTQLCYDFVVAQRQWSWSAHSSKIRLGIFLNKIIPDLKKKQAYGEHSVIQVNGDFKMINRPYVYQIPSLEVCRQQWDKTFGPAGAWPVIAEPVEEQVKEPF